MTTVINEQDVRRTTNGRAFTISSAHRSESAAVRRADKTGSRLVIYCPENAIMKACWLVVSPAEDVSSVVADEADEQLSAPSIRPTWAVLAADRNGNPTERVWRLPRLMWPGLVVLDHVSSARGRYEVMSLKRAHNGDMTMVTTGVRFRRLADLRAYLFSVRAA